MARDTSVLGAINRRIVLEQSVARLVLVWAMRAQLRRLSTPSLRRRYSTAPLPNWEAPTTPALPHWEGADLPVAQASCLPPIYYTSPQIAAAERDVIFKRSWQFLPSAATVSSEGAFKCGTHAGGIRYLLSRAKDGQLRAFRNACRHHHHSVAKGEGTANKFVCPYHGWTYALDGRLMKATGISGIESFKAKEHGLEALHLQQLGVASFAWLGRLPDGEASPPSIVEVLGQQSAEAMEAAVSAYCERPDGSTAYAEDGTQTLVHVASRAYKIDCNWKVFVDNYLDGGLHVPVAHPGLAADLDFGSYTTRMAGDNASVQCVGSKEGDQASARVRGGMKAAYTFVWPNLMLNRYGGGDGTARWLDTNLVVPDLVEPHRKCTVYFDWWTEPEAAADRQYIESSLADSEIVQEEDMALCNDIQLSLDADEGQRGRFAPKHEHAMFHFHKRVYEALQQGVV